MITASLVWHCWTLFLFCIYIVLLAKSVINLKKIWMATWNGCHDSVFQLHLDLCKGRSTDEKLTACGCGWLLASIKEL